MFNVLAWGSHDQGPVFDADYKAVLDRATTLGYTKPSGAQQVLQNQLMLDLKAGSIFANLDIFYVLATNGSDDFSRLNWVTPASFELVEVNAPTFTADQGWDGDGSTNYLDTTWDAATDGVNYTQNAASLAAWVRILDTGTGIYAGQRDTGADGAYLVDITGSTISGSVVQANESPDRVDSTQATGFLHGNRENSTSHQHFLNGVLATDNGASSALNTSDFFILAGSDAGVPTFHHDGQISIVGAGGDLLTEKTDYFNAVNDYITAL